MIKTVSTTAAPAAIGPYCQARVIGGLVFTSGQIALDPASGQMVGDDVAAQTVQVCENLRAVLEAAGSALERVIKTTCYLTDMAHFAEFNRVYGTYFTQTPARSCVAVAALPKQALVEVEVVAAC